jgi:hypothetical protein
MNICKKGQLFLGILHPGWQLGAGSWQLEAGSWELAAGSWELAADPLPCAWAERRLRKSPHWNLAAAYQRTRWKCTSPLTLLPERPSPSARMRTLFYPHRHELCAGKSPSRQFNINACAKSRRHQLSHQVANTQHRAPIKSPSCYIYKQKTLCYLIRKEPSREGRPRSQNLALAPQGLEMVVCQ